MDAASDRTHDFYGEVRMLDFGMVQVFLMRVTAFIEQHLDDPGLSPSAIAAAHNVSVRYLHRLFQPQGVGVAGWVRRRKLERCRADLADPSKRAVPVRLIGARWGFPNEAHFNRTFSAAFDISPAAYRRHAAERAEG
ncbi:helix-turn-helix domain-containing protein [Streptosporangium sp. V21-05]|uniref:helix-turn-helix domain-containing protein n=1 Tax=Streptosporangium sp. V21-05 TaxID=3446115 RepID=UPI003F53C46C